MNFFRPSRGLAALFLMLACLAAPARAEKGNTTDGVFEAIEQGDYAYFQIRDAQKREQTFMILKPDASVGRVLEKPKKFVGKRCRVTWKKRMTDIPEAGGKVKVTEILRVEWLDD